MDPQPLAVSREKEGCGVWQNEDSQTCSALFPSSPCCSRTKPGQRMIFLFLQPSSLSLSPLTRSDPLLLGTCHVQAIL